MVSEGFFNLISISQIVADLLVELLGVLASYSITVIIVIIIIITQIIICISDSAGPLYVTTHCHRPLLIIYASI